MVFLGNQSKWKKEVYQILLEEFYLSGFGNMPVLDSKEEQIDIKDLLLDRSNKYNNYDEMLYSLINSAEEYFINLSKIPSSIKENFNSQISDKLEINEQFRIHANELTSIMINQKQLDNLIALISFIRININEENDSKIEEELNKVLDGFE